MGVLDKLPQGKPLTVLRELDQTSRELKSKQTRSSGSVINYRIASGLPYDILVPGGYSKRVVEIEFVPDNPRIGGVLCYRAYVQVGGVGGYLDELGLRRQIANLDDGRQRWKYQGQFPSATGLKFYFFAQGSGTFSAKLI